ncbi:MAG TPA: hypothetical protein DCM60_08980 [Nitrospina sp.]|nr:hypothetical protein [Nitrospina sp.]
MLLYYQTIALDAAQAGQISWLDFLSPDNFHSLFSFRYKNSGLPKIVKNVRAIGMIKYPFIGSPRVSGNKLSAFFYRVKIG